MTLKEFKKGYIDEEAFIKLFGEKKGNEIIKELKGGLSNE
jgi:hypothetical protein